MDGIISAAVISIPIKLFLVPIAAMSEWKSSINFVGFHDRVSWMLVSFTEEDNNHW